MKQRVVWSRTPRPKITITTATTKPEAWDTLAFESISPKFVETLFRAASVEHRRVILQLATSRLALDNALTTVQDALANIASGSPVELVSDADNAAFDKAYSTGLRLYVYHHVIGVIPDEATRRELLSALAQLQLAQRATGPVAAPAGQRVAGAVKGGSGGDPGPAMEDFLTALEKRIDKKLGPAQPEPAPRKRQTRVERRKR